MKRKTKNPAIIHSNLINLYSLFRPESIQDIIKIIFYQKKKIKFDLYLVFHNSNLSFTDLTVEGSSGCDNFLRADERSKYPSLTSLAISKT